MRLKMKVVPASEVRGLASVLSQENPGKPMIVGAGDGAGDLSLLCGGCSQTLVSTIPPGTLRNIWLECGQCGATNGLPPGA